MLYAQQYCRKEKKHVLELFNFWVLRMGILTLEKRRPTLQQGESKIIPINQSGEKLLIKKLKLHSKKIIKGNISNLERKKYEQWEG